MRQAYLSDEGEGQPAHAGHEQRWQQQTRAGDSQAYDDKVMGQKDRMECETYIESRRFGTDQRARPSLTGLLSAPHDTTRHH